MKSKVETLLSHIAASEISLGELMPVYATLISPPGRIGSDKIILTLRYEVTPTHQVDDGLRFVAFTAKNLAKARFKKNIISLEDMAGAPREISLFDRVPHLIKNSP